MTTGEDEWRSRRIEGGKGGIDVVEEESYKRIYERLLEFILRLCIIHQYRSEEEKIPIEVGWVKYAKKVRRAEVYKKQIHRGEKGCIDRNEKKEIGSGSQKED